MILQGVFKNLARAKGVSVQLRTTEGELIAETTKLKKNKFKLDFMTPKNKAYKGPINIVISDNNGSAANFKNKSGWVDLDPNNQTFKVQINANKSKAKIKLNPQTASDQNQDKNVSFNSDSDSQGDWSLGKIRSLKTPGVSPHLESIGGSYRVSHTDIGMTVVSDLSNNNALTPSGQMEGINDLTIVTSGDGVRRGYYTQRDFYTDEAQIYTAEISDDGLTLINPIGTGITDGGSMAWGVPDSVRLPDGRVRLYWVEDPPAGGKEHKEWIVSATSDDITGTKFTKDPGQRTTGGYVDFEVLQAKPGDWIAVMSSTPAARPEHPPQGIYVGTSKDGLDWNIDSENLAPSNKSYLDPTGVAVSANQWQLVMAERGQPYWGEPSDQDYTLVSTILTLD